ncbi:glycoside hydrolase family 17 protein [Saccharata proteae CBS 121410]|uniref:Probable glucan endo-1,3-beta-glucosidase eglC n=1 Tax=Saccharata proteae CBS 121410 TaxID=1314787 RepID=A0A9P4HS67_9PEZI|nr:glycoside hydrolase family 17 protein [Saccharata proteae CBS 121410]
MKFTTAAIATAAASLPLASAFHKGFNIAAERPDGSCKTQADWAYNFKIMKSLPGNFKDVRVYASSDCNTLANAVPAAIAADVQLLVGVWTQDAAHYTAEKEALKAAIDAHGVSWISAVSVGSEDLYRGEATPEEMAQHVYDVRGMISQKQYGGDGIWVGHVDTYEMWNATSSALIEAVDFVGMDAYPFWQGVTAENGGKTFQEAIDATQGFIKQYNPDAHLWITETGWPTAGPNFDASTASVANGKTYWQQVMCQIAPDYATYWYTLRDYYVAPASQAFGVLDENFQPLFDLQC